MDLNLDDWCDTKDSPLEQEVIKFYDKIQDLVQNLKKRKNEFLLETPLSPVTPSLPPLVEDTPNIPENPLTQLCSVALNDEKKLQLPLLVYSRCEHKELKDGKIYGWIMGIRKTKLKDMYVIFVPTDQDFKTIQSVEEKDFKDKIITLLDTNYIPIDGRFSTLSMASSQLYGKPKSRYASSEIESYHNGGKEWSLIKTHAPIEVLIKEGYVLTGFSLDPKTKLFYPKRKKKTK